MVQRLSLVVIASLCSFSGAAFAEDDFVMSNDNHRVIMGQNPNEQELQEHDLGGDAPSPEPAYGGTANSVPRNNITQQTAQQAPVSQVRQHPTPQLPAGWSTPDDYAAQQQSSFATNSSGMFGNNGYGNNGYGNNYFNSGDFANSNGGVNAGSAISQILQAAGGGGASQGGLAGNAAVSGGSASRVPALPSGFVSPQESAGGFGSGNMINNLQRAVPTSGMMNNLATMAAAGFDEDGYPATERDRVQLAGYFNQLMRYVMSQPSTVLPTGNTGYSSGGYGGASAGSYSAGTATRSLAAGVGSSVKPLAIRQLAR